MSRLGLAIFTAILACATTVRAEIIPQPSAGDPRIRIARYVPDEVVLLNGTLGYAITVEFEAGERIENVSIGNSLGWQVTPNRKANRLFLKPVAQTAPTDMTVVTNLRAYTLDLRVRPQPRRPDRSIIFALKFDYPEPAMAMPEPVVEKPPAPPEPPKDINHAYSYSGSKIGLPLRVFDDGRATYFSFPETADYPAIFAVDSHGKEAAVNMSQRDGLVVIDQLAQAFVLRRGSDVTRVINNRFQVDTDKGSALAGRKTQ